MLTRKIPEANFLAMQGRIAKINRKAVKLGQEPILVNVLGEEIVKVPGEVPSETKAYKVFLVEVTGRPPSVDGWTFIAALEHIDGHVILKTLPGQSIPESYRTATALCEHCKINRARNITYILRNEAGEHKQVGSTCVQDFFSKDIAAVVQRAQYLASLDGILDAAEDFRQGGRFYLYDDLAEYIACVVAIVERHGFISRKKEYEGGGASTARLAANKMRGTRHPDTDAILDAVTVTKQHEEKARAIIAWAEGYLDKPDLSDYEHNLKSILEIGFVDSRTYGLAASLSVLHYRETGEKKEKKEKKAGEYVGTVGERMKSLDVMLSRVVYLGKGTFGNRYIYRFTDAAGNLIVWFSGSAHDAGGDAAEEGVTYKMTGTVKEQSEYGGQRQTVLTRCKLIKLEKEVVR